MTASSASEDDDSSPPLLPFLPLALDDDDNEDEDETNNAKRQQRRPFVLKQRFSNDLARGPSCLDHCGIQVPPTMMTSCHLPPEAAPQLPWIDKQEQEQAMEVDYYDLPLLPMYSSLSSSSDESPLRLRYRSSLQSNPFRCVDDHDDDNDNDNDDVEEEMLYYYDY
jgi:hypothetical protein